MQPLKGRGCTGHDGSACKNNTVVLVFTQVWGYAKVWVLGRFWLRLGPRFGGAADPGFTHRSRGFVAHPENRPLGSFIFSFSPIRAGAVPYNASGPRQTWWFRVCSGARVPAATLICSREWRVRLLILRKPGRVRCRRAGGPTAEGAWPLAGGDFLENIRELCAEAME